MNKKGFTLIELIAVITLFSIISLLVFGALTGSIKSASVKEMEVYRDNVSRAAQVYVETNLENYTLDTPGKYIVLKGAKIIEAGYLDKSIKNPSSCPIEEVNIRIYMESDYTLSYAVYCDGEEPPLSGDAENEEIPEEVPTVPETPSQTVYVFEYTGTVQEMTLPAGKWKLEVWGAQGGAGNKNMYQGGLGGYSYGVINLTQPKQIYVYVGGQGQDSKGSADTSGGFNGGGSSLYNTSATNGGGGGGTDIRIAQDSLYARVIVAGGGGGAGTYNFNNGTSIGTGGAGGGETGEDGKYNSNTQGYGGSLTSGNDFGIGGEGIKSNSGTTGAGGGGGWYGGTGSAAGNSAHNSGAGGGSGYVYNSTTEIYYPAGCLLNSNYYLTDSGTISGTLEFKDPDGTTVTGHSGNGYARITWVSN